MQYEVGQRIDIYKALSTGDHGDAIISEGQFRPCVNSEEKELIGLFCNWQNAEMLQQNDYRYMGALMWDDVECRKVGTMIITKLK